MRIESLRPPTDNRLEVKVIEELLEPVLHFPDLDVRRGSELGNQAFSQM